MSNNFQLQGLAENDVVDFDNNAYRVKKIIDAFSPQLRENLGYSLHNSLKNKKINFSQNTCFTTGIDCQILRVDKPNWQKGKFKLHISMEFIPDKPEPANHSALDAVREEIKNQ